MHALTTFTNLTYKFFNKLKRTRHFLRPPSLFTALTPRTSTRPRNGKIRHPALAVWPRHCHMRPDVAVHGTRCAAPVHQASHVQRQRQHWLYFVVLRVHAAIRWSPLHHVHVSERRNVHQNQRRATVRVPGHAVRQDVRNMSRHD